MKEGEGWGVLLGQTLKTAHAIVNSAQDVVLIEQRPDDDGAQVDGLDVEREKGSLETQDVPAGQLVTAGHGVQLLPGQDPIPRLALVLCRDGPLPGLHLDPHEPPREPLRVSVFWGRLLLIRWGEDACISARRRADVEVE